MRFRLSCVVAALAATAAAPGYAHWHVAQSKHFVIYADENPKALNEFSARLEKFDQAVRFVRGMADPPVGDGNRLTVFVMPSVGAVQRLAGNSFIEGFYTGRASGSLAFVPRKAGSNEPWDLNADTIFFHEYAHHLMFQVLERPLPEWVVEGFAEFMSTVRFERDGDIGIGAPANHRAFSLFEGQALPLETLLAGNYSKISSEEHESIYSRGWLLIHYLTFEKSRSGQLDRYADQIAKGVPPLDAARSAFGDLRQLDHDLKEYMRRSRMTYWKLPGGKLQPGPIDVRPLSEAAENVILLRAASKRGVNEKTAEPLAEKIRAVEARFPGDELVEVTLAEAELDANHFEASETAADRALKTNPKDTEALVFKGRAIIARADKMNGDARHAAFEQARKIFIAANRIDTEDPEPLMQFYMAFLSEGVQPTANAIAALHYSSDLAPQDEGLRMNSALRYLMDGKTTEARRALAPIAYDPHANDLAQIAREIMAKIDSNDSKGALAVATAAAHEDSSTP
jgi:Flp pilus assembly protein TadD